MDRHLFDCRVNKKRAWSVCGSLHFNAACRKRIRASRGNHPPSCRCHPSPWHQRSVRSGSPYRHRGSRTRDDRFSTFGNPPTPDRIRRSIPEIFIDHPTLRRIVALHVVLEDIGGEPPDERARLTGRHRRPNWIDCSNCSNRMRRKK